MLMGLPFYVEAAAFSRIFLGPSGLESVFVIDDVLKAWTYPAHKPPPKRRNILLTLSEKFLITIISHCGNHRTALLPINFTLNSFPAHYHISSNCTNLRRNPNAFWVGLSVFCFRGGSIVLVHWAKQRIDHDTLTAGPNVIKNWQPFWNRIFLSSGDSYWVNDWTFLFDMCNFFECIAWEMGRQKHPHSWPVQKTHSIGVWHSSGRSASSDTWCVCICIFRTYFVSESPHPHPRSCVVCPRDLWMGGSLEMLGKVIMLSQSLISIILSVHVYVICLLLSAQMAREMKRRQRILPINLNTYIKVHL